MMTSMTTVAVNQEGAFMNVNIIGNEVSDMEKRTIWVKSSCFAPEFEMIIPIPTDRDDEEYIDELLDGVLSTEFRYNVEWDFVDGLS